MGVSKQIWLGMFVVASALFLSALVRADETCGTAEWMLKSAPDYGLTSVVFKGGEVRRAIDFVTFDMGNDSVPKGSTDAIVLTAEDGRSGVYIGPHHSVCLRETFSPESARAFINIVRGIGL